MPSSNGEKTARQRDAAGRFAPGNKAGPGRPQGSRNAASVLADRLAEADAEAVITAVVAAARRGEAWAADLVLKRIWPPRRGRPTPLPALPPITSAGDVLPALSALVAAVARGELTTSEAADLAALIETIRRAAETCDLAARIDALERKMRP